MNDGMTRQVFYPAATNLVAHFSALGAKNPTHHIVRCPVVGYIPNEHVGVLEAAVLVPETGSVYPVSEAEELLEYEMQLVTIRPMGEEVQDREVEEAARSWKARQAAMRRTVAESPKHPFPHLDPDKVYGSPPYFDMVDLRGFGAMFGPVGDTMHIVAMGPGLATFLSRDSEFNHVDPKESLARIATEIMEHGGELPKEEGDVGPRIWSADITVHRSAEDRTKKVVWAEQLGDSNQATIFFPHER